jgi:hypothetical protein
MDTSSGEVRRLTPDEEQEILNREGRRAQPGDQIDSKRVVVSRRVAAKMRLANKKEKGRARRKREEARQRAKPDMEVLP